MKSVASFGLAYLALILTIFVGWVINIFDVITLAASAAPVTALFVVKCFGIVVFPLGALLGLFF